MFKFKVWDGVILHDLSEIHWCREGVKWYGPGVGDGWLKVDKLNWPFDEVPRTDLLLKEIEV